MAFADFGEVLQRLVVRVDAGGDAPKVAAKAFGGPKMVPASSLREYQLRSESTVVRLMNIYIVERMGSRGCFCSRVAPIPSTLASQKKREGLELSATESQPGKTKVGASARCCSCLRVYFI